MNTCRTCLKSPASKNISELDKGIEDDNKQCVDIMAFCLDIKIAEDSKITTSLCFDCYRKIISFYKFKTISLKNDAYLRSVHEVQLKDRKITFYVDENGVKHAKYLEPEDCGLNLAAGDTKIGKEIDHSLFSSGNVQVDDTEVKYKETLGVGQTFENRAPINEENLRDTHTQTYEGYDAIVDLFYPSVSLSSCMAADGRRDGEEPSSKVEDIKSKPIKKAKSIAPKKRTFKKPQKKGKKKKVKKEDVSIPPGPHTCEQCGITVMDIKSHSLTHKSKEERTMLKCKACPKMFISRGGRRRHFNIHHLGRKSKCDICNGSYVHLETHIKQVHKKEELRFACETCGRRFVSRPVLEEHLYTHSENKERQFACVLCPKKYAFKKCLRDHIKRTHENIRNYQCEHCTKTFYTRSELVNHVRKHTLERPFECMECGKAFTWRRALVSHMLVHTGVRGFKCQLCEQSFRSTSDLKTHMVTHTKEKRFSCQHCGKCFGRADSCRRHEAGHR